MPFLVTQLCQSNAKKTIRKHLGTEVSHDIRNPTMQLSYFKAVCITRRHLSLMLVIGSAHKICREESMHLSGVRLSVRAWQQTSLPAGDIDRMLHGAQQHGV